MHTKLKKVLVSLGFVAFQGAVLAAFAGIAKTLGSIPAVKRIFYTDISTITHWGAEMGLGFLGLLLLALCLAALAVPGYGIYRWVLWSYDTAETWLKEAEYKRRRLARIRREAKLLAEQEEERRIAEGAVSPRWEV